MDYSNLIWALVGSILGALVQLLIDRIRRTHEDYELWCDTILFGHVPGDERSNGHARSVIDLVFWNAGKFDIRSDDFDQGRPFVIDLHTSIEGELPERHAVKFDFASVQV